MLSERGYKAQHNALRPDLELYFQAAENIYRADNPTGNLLLNIAENGLCRSLLAEKLREIAMANLPDWIFSYTDSRGNAAFRAVMSQFLEKYFAEEALDPNGLAMAVGATAVVELTAFCLGNPGDVALIPAPAYSVYTQDIGIKAGMERINVPMKDVFETGEAQLELEALEAAWRSCRQQGKRVACLILTHPNNPTGQIYREGSLHELADWCIGKEIHLIVSEIYGLSRFDTRFPAIQADYQAEIPFLSFLKIVRQRRSPYLHWWYALSKDFGMSGFRVGMLYSENRGLIQAFSNSSAPHMISNHTQWLLMRLFEEEAFIARYIEENQRLLTKSYALVVQVLRELGIDFSIAYGSLFVWINLKPYLSEDSEEAELALWQAIFDKTGVLLTPGIGGGHSGFGYFRIVYTAVPFEELKVAMQRLKSYLTAVG